MFIFIAIMIIMTSYIVSSDMPDNSKTAYYITLVIIVLLIIITNLF